MSVYLRVVSMSPPRPKEGEGGAYFESSTFQRACHNQNWFPWEAGARASPAVYIFREILEETDI